MPAIPVHSVASMCILPHSVTITRVADSGVMKSMRVMREWVESEESGSQGHYGLRWVGDAYVATFDDVNTAFWFKVRFQ